MGGRTMTRNDLYEIMRNYVGTDAEALHGADAIWGKPFDGETEKIKPVAEESSATLSESFRQPTRTAIKCFCQPLDQPQPN